MTDATVVPKQPEQAAPRLPLVKEMAPAVTLLNQHLGLFTAFVGLVAMGCSVAFLSAYLSVFDRSLMWMIQYTDVLNFALVGIGVLTGIYVLVQNLFVWMYHAVFTEPQHKRRWFIIGLSGISIFTVLPLIFDVFGRGVPHYELHFLILGSVGMTMFYVIFTYRALIQWNTLNIGYVFWWFPSLIPLFLLYGWTFGDYVRDEQGLVHEAITKSGELHAVRVVLMTPHHVVFYTKDKDVLIVPTSDVSQISRENKARATSF